MVRNIVRWDNTSFGLQRYESFSLLPNNCASFFEKICFHILKYLCLLRCVVSRRRQYRFELRPNIQPMALFWECALHLPSLFIEHRCRLMHKRLLYKRIYTLRSPFNTIGMWQEKLLLRCYCVPPLRGDADVVAVGRNEVGSSVGGGDVANNRYVG